MVKLVFYLLCLVLAAPLAIASPGLPNCGGLLAPPKDRLPNISILRERLAEAGVDPSFLTFELATKIDGSRPMEVLSKIEAKIADSYDPYVDSKVIDMLYPLDSDKLVPVFKKIEYEGDIKKLDLDLDNNAYEALQEGETEREFDVDWAGDFLSDNSYSVDTGITRHRRKFKQVILIQLLVPANFLERNPYGKSKFGMDYRIKRDKLREHGVSLTVFINGVAIIPFGMYSHHENMWVDKADLPPVKSLPADF